MIYVYVFLLMILSGILGRMGGAGKSGQWYDFLLDTKWRDVGCSLIVVMVCWMFLGWHPYIYTVVFALHWIMFSTYWDTLFGYDNMEFSGLMVGFALTPIIFIDFSLILFVVFRSIFLMVVWECLNRYLPRQVFFWRRDVSEEFLRYSVSL